MPDLSCWLGMLQLWVMPFDFCMLVFFVFKVAIASSKITPDDVPGGRHDNDFEDFRSVHILPSVGEIECKKDPYLPEILPPMSRSAQGKNYVVICDF